MKFPVDFLREHWKLMLIVFGILLLLGGLFGGLLPLVNLGGIILILGIASSLVLPGKEKETPEPRAGKSKVVPAKGGKAEGAKSFPAKYIVIALVIIAVLVLSQSEPGPGGGEEIAEFTIPPMFFAVLAGVLIVWVSGYVVKARVHFVDPPAYVTRDNQGRQVYVDFSFTWQIENISRWLLVAMTRADIASRLKTEIHSAMALVTSYSCEGADRRRQRIARLVTKTVNSSIVPRYGATCQVTIEHFRLEESIQQQIDAAMTQLLTEGTLGMGDRHYICNLLNLNEDKLDLSNPQVAEAVTRILTEKIRGEYQRDSATSLGAAIGSALGAMGRREQ